MSGTLEIYGTLGPSCENTEILRQMFAEGITGMRLNLSHGTLKKNAGMIDSFHEAAAREGVSSSLLIDLQGPELRIGEVEQGRYLMEGSGVFLVSREKALPDAEGDAAKEQRAVIKGTSCHGGIPVPEEIFDHYEEGMILLIDDGKIRLKASDLIREENGTRIRALVLTGGTLLSRKSIAVQERQITGNTLTKQDLENLSCAAAFGVTDVMQPFVRGAADLAEVRKVMKESGAGNCRLFAKIENRAGIGSLGEILPLTDMLVIARGDLGNAVPLWELPYVQKEISRECLKAGVPFMVVTQMLASMENAPVPTRAEVSDIFNAVADGAGAVMITGESASGRFPVQAASYLVKTARMGLKWREKEQGESKQQDSIKKGDAG